ncbi:Glutathione S-transferase [Lachnellula hyalina]|uniref:Glutathione S-transferase n=1 Tax=Lachnellula hyalina TaxID=1316788 RepID=A0A8H8QVN9_9HELO|nr:Glutathione S-transferase [Lachnellula hyalina]TVY22249.1 Glutathione S-transferase [Lachnellula hyalina]
MEPESVLHQQLPSAYRTLQPQAAQAIQHGHGHGHGHNHGQPHLAHHGMGSQPGLDLTGLDDNDPVFHQDLRLQDPNGHAFQTPNPFERSNIGGHRPMPIQNNGSPHTPQQQHSNGGQFGILTTNPIQHNSIGRLQQEEDLFGSPDGADQKSNGHLSTKIVVDPPNLAEWRQKLFNVDEMITLSEEEFETYFPHVDNVYSHRSTQRYKRKPFVSHYWDCRLKGRPPGTPKSDDPNKKKRKRTARERDLCDVKIKITEYFPGAMLRSGFEPDGGPVQLPDPSQGNNFFAPGQPGAQPMQQQQQFGMSMVNSVIPPNHPGAAGQRYYTIQRVNGNGGNGKGDGIPGPHKHALSESDRVKKNSVQRHVLKQDKEDKKTQKTYHKKASGNALVTVRKRSKDHELKLFGSCFCPFVQRVWVALEAKGLQYQYVEVDPYKKPQALLDVNPRGLVPGIRHGDWGCGESTVLMEYLEDLGAGQPLLPQGNPQLRATCRLWTDHINRQIVPAFYQLLQAQEFQKQAEHTKKLQDKIQEIVEVCDQHGPYFLGPHLSFVDIQFAPWMIRLSRVMKHYRGWPDPTPGSRWGRWMDAVENDEHVKNTTSLDDLYIESYERYAQNRPNTSQLADAVNSGYSLP